MRRFKFIVLLLLLLVSVLLMGSTLAYWPSIFSNLISTDVNINEGLSVGTWDFDKVEFTGNGSVSLGEELIFGKLPGNINTAFINGVDAKEFHNPIIIKMVDDSGKIRYFYLKSPSNAFLEYGDYPIYLPDKATSYYLGEHYKHVELEYYPNIKYNVGDVVLYNGEFYRVKYDWANSNLPNKDEYGAWHFINEQYTNEKSYNKGDIVIIDNMAYIALIDHQVGGSHPSSSVGGWNRYGTLDFVYNNTYVYNDIVYDSSDGIFYRLYGSSSSNLIPSQNPGLWIRADVLNP